MARVKTGVTNHAKHVKTLKLAKGYYGGKHSLYKSAHEQVMHSGKYAFNDRRKKKGEFRKIWIQRINAAARLNGLSYSKLMHGLEVANIEINRKVLADIAVNDAAAFTEICEKAKAAL